MIKEEIQKTIEKAVNDLYPNFNGRQKEGIDVLVERPKEVSHGDYATNIALALATLRHGSGQEKLGKNPVEVANEIVDYINHLPIRANKTIEKMEVAGLGFINFYLSKDFFVQNIKEVLKNKDFGKSNLLKGQKTIIEYTDPNPFKEFHIGHLMSNAIGESISRIFEFQGAKVKRANYQGDVGLHVAKAIWGAKELEEPHKEKFNSKSIEDQIDFWAMAYTYGSKQYEEVDDTKKEIIKINKEIYDPNLRGLNTYYIKGSNATLSAFQKIYNQLDTTFNFEFFESEVENVGRKIVEDGLKKGTFEKGDKGAIIFKGEKYGLHTRVFINSEGLPTYEAKELALAKIKYDKYKYDQSIVITGNEINEYFKVILAAMSQIFPELAEKTKHIGHGMMRLPEGKMSSRTGKVVTFKSLLNKIEELVKEKIKNRDLSEKEKNEIIKKVAVGALKYSILKQSIGSDILYDFEKSISFEGDSGPYLQYSYVRAISVLAKAKAEGIRPSLKKVPMEVGQLEKVMSRFPEIVVTAAGGIPSAGGKKAGATYEPHIIVLYLTELAREFNNYYAHNKIVEKGGEYKVAITRAFSLIMKNGLWLLGIKAPEKM